MKKGLRLRLAAAWDRCAGNRLRGAYHPYSPSSRPPLAW